MHLASYLGLQHRLQTELEAAFAVVSEHHGAEPDVRVICAALAKRASSRGPGLEAAIARYGEVKDDEAERLYEALFKGPRSGGVGLLRDLQDLYMLASMSDVTWQMLRQAAFALRDEALSELSARAGDDTRGTLAWLITRMKAAAPQALIVAR